MPKPWYVDVLTFVLVGVWMAWTFATMQQYGPSASLVGSAALIAVVGVLVIYGQRLKFVQIGEKLQMGFRTPEDYTDSNENERKKWR